MELRHSMVEKQIEGRGVSNENVVRAMKDVPRHEFVPKNMANHAYRDSPLPIGQDQTISQPYIVGLMTEALEPKPEMKVLEIGTGSGYQAAVLGELVKEVYSIEIVPELHEQANKILKKLKYKNVNLKLGDGHQGWEEHAPFDAVILTAAPPKLPQPLIDQLRPGGVIVYPEGNAAGIQNLFRLRKTKDGKLKREFLLGVRFVPMTGKAQK